MFTISHESSRFAALSDDWKRNICWELLEDIHPRGVVYKTGRIPDNHDFYTGYYARPSLTWRKEAGVLPLLAPGVIEKIHDAWLCMEPTCDIGIMVHLSRELLAELKTIIPVRVRDQRIEVLWSGVGTTAHLPEPRLVAVAAQHHGGGLSRRWARPFPVFGDTAASI